MPNTTDMAETEGPNASLEFGQASQMSSLQRESGMLATGPGAPRGNQGSSPAPGGPGGPSPSGPQPPPVQPHPSFDPSQYLSPQKVGGPRPPAAGWYDDLENLATHPKAGPALRSLLRIARQNR